MADVLTKSLRMRESVPNIFYNFFICIIISFSLKRQKSRIYYFVSSVLNYFRASFVFFSKLSKLTSNYKHYKNNFISMLLRGKKR